MPASPTPGDRSLEIELAERLDSVLGIAERLASSHDRQELFRTIVDETRRALRADCTTIRILHEDRLDVAAWAGLTDEMAARLPVFARDEGWVGEVLRTGRVLAFPDVRQVDSHGFDKYADVLEFRGELVAPLIHHDRVIGALTAVTYEPRDWTSGDVAFITTLATHAAIALTNAELFEQTEARAAQLGVLQAASARLSRAGSVEEIGRTVIEETRRIIDYHNARVYVVEIGGGHPDRVRRDRGRLRAGRPRAPALPARRGLHGLGRAARRGPAHQRRERRRARRDDRRHRGRRRIDARGADALRPERSSASSRSRSWVSTSSTATTCGC